MSDANERIEKVARVIIVGAGPAGAALAYLLARSGIDTLLLERHADFEREFRGEGVQPSGFECLAQMGLAEQVATLPQTRIRKVTFSIAGHVVEMPETDDLDAIRVIAQPPLLGLLCRSASAYPHFGLRMGTGVRELLTDSRGRVIGVRVEGDERLYADYVIATDGRHSVVRKRLGIEIESIEQSFDVLWSRASLVGPLVGPDRTHVEMLPKGGFAAIYPAPAGGHQIGVIIRKGGYRELRATGQADSFEWLRERVSPSFWAMLEQAQGQLQKPFSPNGLTKPVLLDVICGRATRWSAPGALLIGDAAHPMSPVGGQCINMALRDAVVSANHLVPLLRQADPLDSDALASALDQAGQAIEAERRPEIEAMQALQTKRARAFDRHYGRASLWLIRALMSLRPILRLLARQRAPFGHGQAHVELRV